MISPFKGMIAFSSLNHSFHMIKIKCSVLKLSCSLNCDISFKNDGVISFTPAGVRHSPTVRPRSAKRWFSGSHKSGFNKSLLTVILLSEILPGNAYEIKKDPPPRISCQLLYHYTKYQLHCDVAFVVWVHMQGQWWWHCNFKFSAVYCTSHIRKFYLHRMWKFLFDC